MDYQFAVFLEGAAYEAAVGAYWDAFSWAYVSGPSYIALVSAEVDGQPENAIRIVPQY